MGWSCEHEAGERLDKIIDLAKDDGFIHYKNNKYFAEVVHKEYKDGKIKMEVYKIVADGKAIKMGSFFIKPGGIISNHTLNKFPFLKEISDKSNNLKIETTHNKDGATLIVNGKVRVKDESEQMIDNIIDCLRPGNFICDITSEASEIADDIKANL